MCIYGISIYLSPYLPLHIVLYHVNPIYIYSIQYCIVLNPSTDTAYSIVSC